MATSAAVSNSNRVILTAGEEIDREVATEGTRRQIRGHGETIVLTNGGLIK